MGRTHQFPSFLGTRLSAAAGFTARRGRRRRDMTPAYAPVSGILVESGAGLAAQSPGIDRRDQCGGRLPTRVPERVDEGALNRERHIIAHHIQTLEGPHRRTGGLHDAVYFGWIHAAVLVPFDGVVEIREQ